MTLSLSHGPSVRTYKMTLMVSSDRTLQIFVNVGFPLVMAVTICVVFILTATVHNSDGILRFASYYGDHMVLQKSPESAVLWGYGPEGEEVTISLSGPTKQNSVTATVTKGIWRVTLDPVEAGGPYTVIAEVENSTATLTDVLFGDVWLCGGQSNMCFSTSMIFNASQELKLAAKYPHVRPFEVALKPSETELIDLIQVELPWSVPTASNVAGFSAVCWLFGRYMYEKLQYPIGLVESCWGGTPVEAWSSSRVVQQCGLEQGKESPPQARNSALWNAMIHPLLNMTIKGAIWYQGESNAQFHQEQYNCSFPAMINDWRMAFHEGSGKQTAQDFPFGFVQLCTYEKESKDDSFPNIRWHQTADIGYVPNPRMQKTFMAVTLDLPDEKSPHGSIHPRDKQDVAHRLTLGARAVAYNEKDVPFRGPFPIHILHNRTIMYVNITYDQTISATPSKGIFEICCSRIKAPCGPKSRWVPVLGKRSSPTNVYLFGISCPSTDQVAAVRYAWRDWPCDFKACPVYSASGVLPAPPFILNRYPEKVSIWKSY